MSQYGGSWSMTLVSPELTERIVSKWNTVLCDWLKYKGDTAKMRIWLDSVNEHQNTVTATLQLETILIIGAFTGRVRKHYKPSPLGPLFIMQMNFDFPQFFLDCVGYQQYYKPANCTTFGWTVQLFEVAKVKKRNSPAFLKFQWWQISLYEQQRMMSILHGIFLHHFH